MTGGTPALELRGVRKSFGPIEILHGIDFALHPGEVHALIGENGAGKSTMMKILGGFLAPSEGQVLLDGAPAGFRSGPAAEEQGVVVIHQEFNLAQDLTVADNIFLGREKGGFFLNHKAQRVRRRNCWISWNAVSIPTPASATCRCRTARWSRSPRRCRAMPAY